MVSDYSEGLEHLKEGFKVWATVNKAHRICWRMKNELGNWKTRSKFCSLGKTRWKIEFRYWEGEWREGDKEHRWVNAHLTGEGDDGGSYFTFDGVIFLRTT